MNTTTELQPHAGNGTAIAQRSAAGPAIVTEEHRKSCGK